MTIAGFPKAALLDARFWAGFVQRALPGRVWDAVLDANRLGRMPSRPILPWLFQTLSGRYIEENAPWLPSSTFDVPKISQRRPPSALSFC